MCIIYSKGLLEVFKSMKYINGNICMNLGKNFCCDLSLLKMEICRDF